MVKEKSEKQRWLRVKYGEPKGPWDKFREYLFVEQSLMAVGRNWEARALFGIIQHAFDGSGSVKPVTIDPYLLHNLAACACAVMEYDKGVLIPWEDHDDILKRTFNGFVATIVRAVQNSETHETQGEVCFGHLSLPEWFVHWAKEEAAQEH